MDVIVCTQPGHPIRLAVQTVPLLEEQANSYEAAYRTFWNLEWFDGMFWWLWRTDPWDGHSSDSGFSPVGKPAENVMTKWYSQKINKSF